MLAAACWLATQLPAFAASPQDVADIRLLEGFQIEKVYQVPEDQGSWVSLTTDPRGRLIASDQYGKLYRITAPIGEPAQVETIPVDIGFAQGLLCAFDSLYVMAHEGEGRPSGLYRVRDTDGDDTYDSVELLRPMRGGGEHGPHAIILAPDQQSIIVCCGNHTDLTPVDVSRVPQCWQEDQLLPRLWDPGGHAVGRMAPGGWICRTDPDGRSFELISMGYRNQYDIALDANGELFTYDADMEWDIGMPWYRPTRVCHAVPGSEFGWRSGNYKWPEYYPDSLPAVVDIGPGSPTGIVFGTGAAFPEKYQRALYLCDWSYGVIYAVHLSPEGATYRGEAEVFCSAPALQATDIVIGTDGALYFATGGRRTESNLYRITYHGAESTAPAAAQPIDPAVAMRRELESYLAAPRDRAAEVIAACWPHLSSEDRWIRFAARSAIEHQPTEAWIERLVQENETWTLLEAAMAAARTGGASDRAAAIDALGRVDWSSLSAQQRLHLIRDYALLLLRSAEDPAAARAAILDRMNANFPSGPDAVDRELCRLLAAAESPDLVERAIPLLIGSATQEEGIHYAASLRVCKEGWTGDLRRAYLQWFLDAANLAGGNSFGGYLAAIREDAVKSLSDADRAALADLLNQSPQPQDPYAELKARPFVRQWKVDDLAAELKEGLSERDFENGKRMFVLAQCFKCHRFQGEGGYVGPDLTAIGRRYSRQELWESLVDPNRVISDQYQSTKFLLSDGRTVTGRVVNLSGDDFMVQTDMLQPARLTHVNVNMIDEHSASTVSMMPEGLLDTLTRDEILDLMAYLRSGGDRNFEELSSSPSGDSK